MTYTSRISSKGQVTVPRQVRQRLGVKAGDRVEFALEAGRTVLRPVRDREDPLAKYVGALGGFPGGSEEVIAWVREMRDDEGSG